MKLARPLLVLFASLTTMALSWTPAAAPVRAGNIAELGWIAGHWSADQGGMSMEEAWLAPKGGIMLGLHRDVRTAADKLASFEYLRIEERADGIFYVASPSGGPSTDFRLRELTDQKAVFENPEHDFPKRIIYSRADDVLTARIEGDDDKGMQWSWKLEP